MQTDTVVPIFTKTATGQVVNKMEAAVDMYYFPASPPSRAVLLLAKAMGLQLNLKMVNIMAGEQTTPEFIKMNPMHSVPTMDDHGLIIFESRAILTYLANQYGNEDTFYPKDPKEAAVVNNLLYFDANTLFTRLFMYFFPVMTGKEQPNPEKREKIEEALAVLDTLIDNKKYAAGDRMTVADFSLVATVSTAEAAQVDVTSQYPNIKSWYERCKKDMAGYDEINQKGADMIAAGFKMRL